MCLVHESHGNAPVTVECSAVIGYFQPCLRVFDGDSGSDFYKIHKHQSGLKDSLGKNDPAQQKLNLASGPSSTPEPRRTLATT